MTETVGLLVLTGGVVGVGQTRHEDDTSFLAKCLHSHSNTGGRATSDHDRAVFFNHRLRGRTCSVWLGLCIACDVLDFLAEDAVAFQSIGRERVHHAAVAATVQVLDRQLVSAQLVRALIGIRAGLRHVEAEGHGVAGRGVHVGMGIGPGLAIEECRGRETGSEGNAPGKQTAAADIGFHNTHGVPPEISLGF